jgi:hypothetical protein
MFPVEEFYLEHILSLTNYLGQPKGGSRKRTAAAAGAEQGLQQLTTQLAVTSVTAGSSAEAKAVALPPQSDDVVVENRYR